MQGKMWGNEYRTTMVCVDACEGGVPDGRLYNPVIPEGERFHGVMEFLTRMENLLDQMKFPQPYSQSRSFGPIPESTGTTAPSAPPTGKCATFAIRVLFRQNASWQGSVTWLESSRTESFRSVLELLMLMHSVFANLDSKPAQADSE